MNEIVHGGRLDEAVKQFGGPRDAWVDLSTGINPHTYPVPEISAAAWADLPDEAATDRAADAARAAYGADALAGVSLAAGSQMHIQVLPYLFKPQPIAIVGFTYQEHGVCWRRAGHEVYVTDGLGSAEATARIVIVVNPNNPDGRVFDRSDLVSLARRLGAKGGMLIVDESFADVSPHSSVAEEAGRDGLFVMRSLGKFFGLAGVRLGVGLGSQALISRLNERLGPWPVSGAALEIATDCLSNTAWHRKMLKKLNNEREKLEEVLIANGHEIVGGTALFVLSRHGGATELWQHLAQAKILTRSFPGKPDWLRFGLPAGRAALNKLNRTLADFYKMD